MMIRSSMSTVACPEWSLSRVADSAAAFGYDGVELRTFGPGSTRFACDPALSSTTKTRRLFADAGVEIDCIATGFAFDEPFRPPVIGRVIGDPEHPVRQIKWAIDLARELECPFVRAFGYHVENGANRKRTVECIAWRLSLAADACDKTGVRLAIENAGSFPTATTLCEILDAVDSPLLGASYSMAVATAAGEDPVSGINVLGDRLLLGKVKDVSDGRPCVPGAGSMPCRAFLRALDSAGFAGPTVFEWDRAWFADLVEIEGVLGAVPRLFHDWTVGPASAEAAPSSPEPIGSVG